MKIFSIELSIIDLIIIGWLVQNVFPLIFNKENKEWCIKKAWPAIKYTFIEKENDTQDDSKLDKK